MKSSFMRNDIKAAVAISSEGKACLNVVSGEVGKIVQHLRNGHATAEIIEHVSHGDTGAADVGLAATVARGDYDSLAIIHGRS